MKIERVEVRVVAPQVQRFTWSHDLPDQFATNTLVRIFTDEGVEGVGGAWNGTSFDYDRYTAETLRHLAPTLVGRDPLDREALRRDLWPRVFPIPPQAIAAIDIALWDLAGKAAGMPLYKLIGATRDRIPSYASTPMLDDVPAYLDFVETLLDQGFNAVKFHTWCIPEQDAALARAVRQKHPGNEIAFMLDAENNYDRESALRVAKELESLDFTWFEAPLPDYDLEGYRALAEAVEMPVLPSGNWIMDLVTFESAVKSGCWRASRTDALILGGITPLRKAVEISESAGINCEIMSWGFNLNSTANLHLMLTTDNCSYFEQTMPYEPYEYGMIDVVRTQADGYVYAPEKPGLGLDVDWEAMEHATIHSLTFP